MMISSKMTIMMLILVLTRSVPSHCALVTVNNGVTKTIPDEVQGLDVLVSFHMSYHYLAGTLPLDALAKTIIATKPHLFADQLGTDHFLQRILLQSTNVTGTLSSTIANGLPTLLRVISQKRRAPVLFKRKLIFGE